MAVAAAEAATEAVLTSNQTTAEVRVESRSHRNEFKYYQGDQGGARSGFELLWKIKLKYIIYATY